MNPKVYNYSFKPLFLASVIFLAAFPIIAGGITWIVGLGYPLVIIGLAVVYGCDVVVLGALFLVTWNKVLIISTHSILFRNKLFSREYEAGEISEITLLATDEGREYLRITAGRKTYYLDEKYRAWGSLINELEKFVNVNKIESNLA